MSDERRRTAAEREAAWREREARRPGRGGGSESGVAGPGTPAPAPALLRSVPAALESTASDAAAPEPAAPQAAPNPEQSATTDSPAAEVPSGIRRVGRARRAANRPRPARAPRRTAGPGPWRDAGGSGGHSVAGRVVASLALVLAGVLAWFLFELFQPFHAAGHGSVTVTIPAHTSSRRVGDLLERDGVVASGFFFELRALLAGERSDLRAGTYRLERDMSYGGALSVLTTPPPVAKVTNLTIIEGKTRGEIATLLRSQGIHGDYLAMTRRSRLLDPSHYGAPRSTSTLEGFLFPSTYQLRDPISMLALIDDQLNTFRQRFSTVGPGDARRPRVTAYDVLIVASMVQAEAQTDRDRPLIASVIYNRLRNGMPLQIDATVRYAVGNYTTPITVSQLNSGSPYNTYVHKGLPPAPIDNPGLASIQAAAHPAGTSYLYFVVKPCGNGEHAFASSYPQFLAAARKYQSARTQRGGRSPAHC